HHPRATNAVAPATTSATLRKRLIFPTDYEKQLPAGPHPSGLGPALGRSGASRQRPLVVQAAPNVSHRVPPAGFLIVVVPKPPFQGWRLGDVEYCVHQTAPLSETPFVSALQVLPRRCWIPSNL